MARAKKPVSSRTKNLRVRLSGQVALVTGATRGIGLGVARKLAVQGCSLVIAGRDESALGRVSRELGRRKIHVLAQPCDVRSPDSVDALFRGIRQRFGRLDIVVNNAGIAHATLPIADTPLQVWKDVIETNLDGMFLVSQAALSLLKRGGTIVNNLSVAAKNVFPGWGAYCASKHGALGLTSTLREELRPKGIRVIGVLPGATDTDMWEMPWPGAPRGKMMSAETVAEAIVNAILLPANATVETLEIRPSSGSL